MKLLLVLVLVAGVLIGLAIPRFAQVSYVTREVGMPYPVEKIVEKPVYIDREVIKEVEKVVYQDKLVIPHWFTSEAELTAWLSTHRIGIELPIPLIAGKDGKTNLNNNPFDCDDWSELLMFEAFKDGYLILPTPVNQGYLWGDFVYSDTGSGGLHIGNWTWIGNNFYYVDAQNKNKVTKLQTLRDLP